MKADLILLHLSVKTYWFATWTWQRGEKTASHSLREDLLIFHNNLWGQPPRLTLFTQRGVSLKRSLWLNFTTSSIYSRLIAPKTEPVHLFWLHASAFLSKGELMLVGQQIFEGGVNWFVHSVHSNRGFLCISMLFIYIQDRYVRQKHTVE